MLFSDILGGIVYDYFADGEHFNSSLVLNFSTGNQRMCDKKKFSLQKVTP